MFDLSDYKLRQLDPKQGTKPLDFGGGGITGSVNLDGRLIAINTYHPEHGYITLTSIPPFPDEDRYDQKKVRAYRKSLVTNEGFGLQFEQEIVKREYYLIEDAVPFMRFTLEDGTIAECVISYGDRDYNFTSALSLGKIAQQTWRFSKKNVDVKMCGGMWLQRASYTQLTEGGVIPNIPATSIAEEIQENGIKLSNKVSAIRNRKLSVPVFVNEFPLVSNSEGYVEFESNELLSKDTVALYFSFGVITEVSHTLNPLRNVVKIPEKNSLLINRALIYGALCQDVAGCMLTDHMILPLLWTRDSYYVAKAMRFFSQSSNSTRRHIGWLFQHAWRGTYCKSLNRPLALGWGRAYMANGIPKDNKAFQLDQQLYPFLELAEYILETNDTSYAKRYLRHVEDLLLLLLQVGVERRDRLQQISRTLYVTDETPADDEIPLHYHFSTHILMWYILKKLHSVFNEIWQSETQRIDWLISDLERDIPHFFITEHKGKKIYSYATDGEGNHYLYHDANDIPLVMMPLWGFCDKDDPIWRNTIDFGFSSDNPGFYDGVLGSVHTPAPWSLGDAQELILSKVIGDRERYQRVWERVEKAAQWDGALPEAYDANTFEVVSRHWFAWTNAMVAIADSISWNWETEGEYAR